MFFIVTRWIQVHTNLCVHSPGEPCTSLHCQRSQSSQELTYKNKDIIYITKKHIQQHRSVFSWKGGTQSESEENERPNPVTKFHLSFIYKYSQNLFMFHTSERDSIWRYIFAQLPLNCHPWHKRLSVLWFNGHNYRRDCKLARLWFHNAMYNGAWAASCSIWFASRSQVLIEWVENEEIVSSHLTYNICKQQ